MNIPCLVLKWRLPSGVILTSTLGRPDDAPGVCPVRDVGLEDRPGRGRGGVMGEGKVKAALDALREWAGKGAKVREDERRAFKYYLRLWEGLTAAERRRMSVQFRAGGGR